MITEKAGNRRIRECIQYASLKSAKLNFFIVSMYSSGGNKIFLNQRCHGQKSVSSNNK
jgi:hypothetical protein